jgi:Fur family peroxide stress response transcriptional regulator
MERHYPFQKKNKYQRDPAVSQNTKNLDDSLTRVEAVLKAAGFRLTYQRVEIFRELAKADDHPTVETLHQRLKAKMPTLSLDTIYRTLATFEQHGLVTRVQTVESQGHFEANFTPHHHLICERCGRIIDFQWQAFDEAELPEDISGWGPISFRQAILHGLCPECRRLSRKNKPS